MTKQHAYIAIMLVYDAETPIYQNELPSSYTANRRNKMEYLYSFSYYI